MDSLKNISQIDSNRLEGRYLMAALVIMSQSPKLQILGNEVDGCRRGPDSLLHDVHALMQEMFKGTDIPLREEAPKTFLKQIEELINRHSNENGSATPDFILADFLNGCLEVYNKALQAREKWYGREIKLGGAEHEVDHQG